MRFPVSTRLNRSLCIYMNILSSCFLSARSTQNPLASFAGISKSSERLTANSLSRKMATSAANKYTYLGQDQAKALDECLMGEEYGFTLQQLMELAGLSVSQCIYDAYPPTQFRRVLVICGPGNNGGDGLVCARHLNAFGYRVDILYPKKGKNPFYDNLLKQIKSEPIQVLEKPPSNTTEFKEYDLLVDAIFGFSFVGELRPPFDFIIQGMRDSSVPIVSVDVPSGWDIDSGIKKEKEGEYIKPECLISLSAPKICTRNFQGKHHYLGGRFIDESLKKRFNLTLPDFPGSAQFVKLE